MVNKQKILIVDDDANIAELISLYLTKECFDTMIVEDGESALRAVDTFAPNLILLDLMQLEMEKRGIYHMYFVSTDAPGRRFYERHGITVFRTFTDYRKNFKSATSDNASLEDYIVYMMKYEYFYDLVEKTLVKK